MLQRNCVRSPSMLIGPAGGNLQERYPVCWEWTAKQNSTFWFRCQLHVCCG